MPTIWRNLIFRSSLNKHGFHVVFEADKFEFINNGVFYGSGYKYGGMFKFNVMVAKPKMNENVSHTYMLGSSDVWHSRLGQVNYDIIRRLIALNHIFNFFYKS